MVQTRIEEKLEAFDQEVIEMKKELSKILVIESSLNEITRNMELMRLQSKKQQQMLMMIMETVMKERSIASERLTESMVGDSTSTKMKENEASSSHDIEVEKHEKKRDHDDDNK
ncbi:histone-lysine N-methyltransferase ASHR1 isoform X3 [Cucumis melo var. makuwa]|uniref:Histone-lysine N-methyltransferase ASHR1 isoform X3 n=1 Tax=Cucumis melo var. makuwa TaxID=1194695 RepID=A0A5A7TM83_CUCMM|nr:histone-lysine N-methyltransferase ASHR1 isoform X3 [Cucumis melo var. makuwa]TYK05290.1 histone-lysine N-methyltransferase ASHR1 isoform X3 [Cucumis melo var. makuwa]